VIVIVLDSIRVWMEITFARSERRVNESPFVRSTLRPGAV
jgi:hypothetical protein